MSKKYPLLLFCFLLPVGLYAAERVPGQIVYADKTVDVTLIIPVVLFGGEPNTEALQNRVRYLDAKSKKHWLRADEAKEFRFSLNGHDYRMVSRQYVESLLSRSSSIFLLQLIDGPVKMFEHRQTTTTAAGPNTPVMTNEQINYLLQRGDEWILEPRMLGFRKEMSEYFADCPVLVTLIQEKEFKRKDIGEIVMFYNTKCQ